MGNGDDTREINANATDNYAAAAADDDDVCS